MRQASWAPVSSFEVIRGTAILQQLLESMREERRENLLQLIDLFYEPYFGAWPLTIETSPGSLSTVFPPHVWPWGGRLFLRAPLHHVFDPSSPCVGRLPLVLRSAWYAAQVVICMTWHDMASLHSNFTSFFLYDFAMLPYCCCIWCHAFNLSLFFQSCGQCRQPILWWRPWNGSAKPIRGGAADRWH